MFSQFWRRILNSYRNLSLQNIITLPLLLQIFVTVSLVGYFSWRNGEKAVDRATLRFRNELTARVKQHLEEYLNTPHLIVKLKQNSLKTKQLVIDDFKTIEHDFWLTIKLFNSVKAIYLGDDTGKFIYQKKERNRFYSKEVTTIPLRKTYLLNNRGERQKLIAKDKYYPQSRPWYTKTLKTQRNNWSDVYTFTGGELGITAAGLLQNSQGNTKGIVGVDLVLSGIDRFLENIEISENGQAFILERNGYLIATSSPEKPFIINPKNNREQRLKATDSQEDLIKYTTGYITKQFESLNQIDRIEQLKFKLNREKQLVQVLPYKDELGLDWLIVLVIPEADFMAEIKASNLNTIWLCLLAGAIATGMGIYTSRKIAQPLTHLSQVTNFIAKSARAKNTSTYFYPIIKAKSIKELQSFAHSFNEMASQLKTAFRELEYANATLEKRVEERTIALMTAKEAADAANRAKSQFLANMSHEFRTPLHAILGFTQIALQNPSLQSQQKENLLTVKNSGEHLLTLINDVLSMSKIEAGSLGVDFKVFDLHLLLNNLFKMFQLRASERYIALKFNVPDNIPQYIETDPIKLNQILINLIENAIKYTEKGSVTLNLKLIVKENYTTIAFAIIDTGHGILPSQLESIFMPFTQVKRATQEGTGLGLSISQQFARLLGGEITVSSKLGRGSLFKFQIPIKIVAKDNFESDRKTIISLPQNNLQPTTNKEINPEDLLIMPAQWREKLAQAAIAIDSEQILQLIDLIPDDKQDLARALTKMLDRFEYDEIIAAIEPTKLSKNINNDSDKK